MISVVKKKNETYSIDFVWEKDAHIRSYRMGLEKVFEGKYLETMLVPLRGQAVLLAGCGKEEELGLLQVKEITAAVSRRCKELHIGEISLDPGFFVKKLGKKAVTAVVLGLGLGGYSYTYRKTEKDTASDCNFQLENGEGFADSLQEGRELLNGILFARDMVNTPGNHLRPMDFARKITDYVDGGDVETELLVYGQLRALRLEALYGVGGSSEYPPCLLILRYRGAPGSGDIYGLIGKGITCDTGGYCLKESSSMAGIKGDMAGAAAVAAAVHAAAARKLKVNITACLPLSENRISQSALLPGDVITGYSGRTIEVLNTDAEGRLVLSDAISYGIRREGITKVLDIATLTGAAAQMLGNTIGGTMSDDEAFYHMFERAQTFSAERYLRLPFGKEHEKMIDSDVADVKNIGGGCCGTITAGLFLRRFCEGKPWIHMDIAGTAWCGTPTYAFESKGATGAGVTTLYYLLKEAQL
ncbi:leucyl aminopeptidase family protein [Eisenbergiella sp.]|uniref:leucyl aminopeptidase family protein n=1 Tax=Eisenbergiella sp. TaxID=1924109 RepID=UPI002A808A2C|nr:leucyl aminopeptidase family protein [Eisenbergiella sp.]